MNFNLVDVIIVLVILLGGVIGFKEGVFKKLVSAVGLFLIVIIAFILKNHLSIIFYENLPFFNFWGIFKGIQVLNIIFYEMVAFLVIAAVLTIIYNVLLGVTGLIERALKATVILGIPSKILGFFVGLLENYIWVYIILFVLTLPIFNLKPVYDSKVSVFIINKTPILSKYTNKSIEIYKDLKEVVLLDKNKPAKEVNQDALEVMLRYEIISRESVKKLIEKNKIIVSDESFLEDY